MHRPGLDIVELEGIGVFRLEGRIAVLYIGGVAHIHEGIELPAPGTAYAARIVDLHLIVHRQRIGEIGRGEESEFVAPIPVDVIFGLTVAEGFGGYLPSLAAQTGRETEVLDLSAQGEVEG